MKMIPMCQTQANVELTLLTIYSTLPPSEEGVLHHPQLVLAEHKLALKQSFDEDACHLVIRGDILELHNPPLNIVHDEAVPDLNVLGPVMKHWIL